MPAIDALLDRLPVLLLVAVRVGALLWVAPCFNSRTLPAAVRLWLTMVLAALLLPVVGREVVGPIDPVACAVGAAREAAVGLLLGLAVQVLMSAAQYGGRLAGVNVGFGFASAVDPSGDEQQAYLDRLTEMLALVLFLTLGAHRMVLGALAQSFSLVPLGTAAFPTRLVDSFLELFTQAVVIAVQIAAPVIASVTLAELAIGILSRSVPAFNLFSVGFGIRIALGIVVFGLVAPASVLLVQGAIGRVPAALHGLLAQLAP